MPRNKKKLVVYFTSGGPAPGMNAVTHALTVFLLRQMGYIVIALEKGLSNARERKFARHQVLDENAIKSLRMRGGSVAKNARASIRKGTEDLANILEMIAYLEDRYNAELVAVIGNGGNDTFESVVKLSEELSQRGITVLHLAKTIDNDLWLPLDMSFSPFLEAPDVSIPGYCSYGYSTVCSSMGKRIGSSVLDAETYGQGIYIIETMGRLPGWIAYGSAKCAESSYRQQTDEYVRGRLGPLAFSLEVAEKLKIKDISLDRFAEIIAGSLRNRLTDKVTIDDVIVLSEGSKRILNDDSTALLCELAETTPEKLPVDEFGHPDNSSLPIVKPLAKRVGKLLGVKGRDLVMGYGTRCLTPDSLGSGDCLSDWHKSR